MAEQYLAAELKPAIDCRAVAAAYQAYVRKDRYERSLIEYEKLPTTRKLATVRPADPMKGVSLFELSEMVSDAFEAAYPKLNTCAAGAAGPETLKVQADIVVHGPGRLGAFMHEEDMKKLLFHEEHRVYTPESVVGKDESAFLAALPGDGAVKLVPESLPTSRQLGFRMEQNGFLKGFHRAFDEALIELRNNIAKPLSARDSERLLDDVRTFQREKKSELSRAGVVLLELSSDHSLEVTSADGYVSQKIRLCKMRDDFLKDADKNTLENRIRYRILEDNLAIFRLHKLGDEIAKNTREKCPSGLDINELLDFTKRDYKLVVHHDWFEEQYTDVCYSKFVANARMDGHSPSEILSAIRSDMEANSVAHSKMDGKTVMSLSLYVDERLIDGLDRHCEVYASKGLSGGLDTIRFNQGLIDSFDALNGNAVGSNDLADAFIRRVEGPELYQAPGEVGLRVPVRILSEDMQNVAKNLYEAGERDRLNDFLHDAGIFSFDSETTLASHFDRAAEAIYGNGDAEAVGRVESLRSKWKNQFDSVRETKIRSGQKLSFPKGLKIGRP